VTPAALYALGRVWIRPRPFVLFALRCVRPRAPWPNHGRPRVLHVEEVSLVDSIDRVADFRKVSDVNNAAENLERLLAKSHRGVVGALELVELERSTLSDPRLGELSQHVRTLVGELEHVRELETPLGIAHVAARELADEASALARELHEQLVELLDEEGRRG
jgi:hypothetical protein